MADHSTYELARFHQAQAGTYSQALGELKRGRKETHWMWFIFPQIAGLGHSAMSRKYAISGLDEARAYLAHPVLGPRLIECTRLVGVSGRPIADIFGSPDDMKFRSSMTLFAKAQGEGVFSEAVEAMCGGVFDEATLAKL